MTEDVKKVDAVDTSEEKKEETPTVVYSYTINRMSTGLYDVTDLKSIDLREAVRDIADLGRKLEHDIIVQDAISQFYAIEQEAAKLAQKQTEAGAETAEPRVESTKSA